MIQDRSVQLEQYFTKPHVAKDSIQIINDTRSLCLYGHNAFLFKNTNFTTQGAYLLTRIVF